MGEGCPICAKHRGEGPLVGPVVWQGGLVVVSHRPVDDAPAGTPGHLFVETRRHVAALDELEPDEVAAVAEAAWRAARALRAELDPMSVFSAIVGRRVPHFHQHVFVRHAGTPDDIGWMDGLLWAGAPRLTSDEVVELCGRLRRYFPDPAGSG